MTRPAVHNVQTHDGRVIGFDTERLTARPLEHRGTTPWPAAPGSYERDIDHPVGPHRFYRLVRTP
jgi:hypothetical protein